MIVILFLLFTVGNQVMAYQDMAMLAVGNPKFIFWRNIACNVPTSLFLILLVPLVKIDTVVVYAFMLPNLIVVAYTGLITLPKAVPGYRFLGAFEPTMVRGIWRYGFTNHLGNLLWALPAFLLPIFVVSFDSFEAGGVFAIAWALTGAVFIIPRTVSTAFFAQLSKSASSCWRSIIVAGVIVFGLGIPSVLILWKVSPLLLSLFGKSYVDTALLGTMLLSFIPFSINTLLFSLLRVSRQIWWIVMFSASYALTVISMTLAMSPEGIEGIADGWLAGNALAIVPGFITVFLSQRHDREES
ncbi:MAG: hypothetical protein AMJ56_14280 [Anaerolineae bacterium SG8_19]|nr:MAG: hypothetical protein AMJ56_14280 [Anaerolineae bacterium SG8_19]